MYKYFISQIGGNMEEEKSKLKVFVPGFFVGLCLYFPLWIPVIFFKGFLDSLGISLLMSPNGGYAIELHEMILCMFAPFGAALSAGLLSVLFHNIFAYKLAWAIGALVGCFFYMILPWGLYLPPIGG